MRGLRVLLTKEMREQWRTSRLLVVCALFLFFGLVSPLVARYQGELLRRFVSDLQITLPPPTARDAVDQLLKNLGQTGPFAAILLAMGAVAREKERGTAALVLTKPVSRTAFLAAKFLALAATLAAGVALGGAAAYLYTAILFERLPVGGFLACCGLVLLTLLVYAAVTFLGSTLVDSTLPAAGIGLAALFAAGLVGISPGLQRYTPSGLAAPARALALGQGSAGLWTPLLVSLGIVVAALALAWLSFRHQEIGG